MSLISGSYSRACGGGGAPDCRGDIVENGLTEEILGVAPNFARDEAARGARRARLWRAGKRRFLVAVRTPRLMVDILSIDLGEKTSKLEKEK